MFFRSLLLHHGYALLFFYIFTVQAGAPIPADPLILMQGALAGDGHYSFWLSLLTVLAASSIGDWFWYELGRRRGRSVLSLLCKLTLEPDSCVRRAELDFNKRGLYSLFFAKFVPGLSLVSIPLAGVVKMPRWRFLLVDAAGTALWSGTYLLVGLLFHRQVDMVIGTLGLFGRRAGLIAILLVAAFTGWKYWQRYRLHRELRINRLTPAEALALLNGGEGYTVVDLRNPADIAEHGLIISGALVLRPDELNSRAHEIPDDHEVILYCS